MSAAVDSSEYPFNLDHEGWPEPVYAPPYPFEHYQDNGRNSHDIQPKSSAHYELQSDSNYILPLAIRRHTPGSTDPTPPPTLTRTYSPAINKDLNVKRKISQPTPRSILSRKHITNIVDPDERPIRPMKDKSVYDNSSTQKKTYQPRKPFVTPLQQPRTPIQPSPRTPIQPSPRFESNSFQRTPVSSHSRISQTSQRRPIRADLIPKTSFTTLPPPPPPPQNRTRRVIVEEYYDDNEDFYPPVSYVPPAPKKIVSYKKVSGMTTREWENYQMSKSRRVVRVQSPPVETIIYHTYE